MSEQDLKRQIADLSVLVRQLQARRVVLEGAGSPENVVAAPVGALWTRNDGGPGTTLYVKESGGETNTGWTAK